jgi:hypothetical protein
MNDSQVQEAKQLFEAGLVTHKASCIQEAKALYQNGLQLNPEDKQTQFYLETLNEKHGRQLKAKHFHQVHQGMKIFRGVMALLMLLFVLVTVALFVLMG